MKGKLICRLKNKTFIKSSPCLRVLNNGRYTTNKTNSNGTIKCQITDAQNRKIKEK